MLTHRVVVICPVGHVRFAGGVVSRTVVTVTTVVKLGLNGLNGGLATVTRV